MERNNIINKDYTDEKYEQTINLAPYNINKERFSFINYDDITELYENTARVNKLESKLFK